jgi:hypothetical protein
MQIHELTKRSLKEASIADRIKTGVQNIQTRAAAANVTAGQAQQDKIQAQAAQYAAKLRAQGFTGQTATAPTSAVAAGQRVKVIHTPPNQPNGPKSNYYKTDKGWENELGQAITDPKSIAYLEQLYTAQIRPTTGATIAPSQTGAIMTSVDVDQAIRQLGLSQQQLKAFQAQATQNPGFVQAFLKRLGLVR